MCRRNQQKEKYYQQTLRDAAAHLSFEYPWRPSWGPVRVGLTKEHGKLTSNFEQKSSSPLVLHCRTGRKWLYQRSDIHLDNRVCMHYTYVYAKWQIKIGSFTCFVRGYSLSESKVSVPLCTTMQLYASDDVLLFIGTCAALFIRSGA